MYINMPLAFKGLKVFILRMWNKKVRIVMINIQFFTVCAVKIYTMTIFQFQSRVFEVKVCTLYTHVAILIYVMNLIK